MHRHRFVGLAALLAVAVASASACAGSDALTGGASETKAGVFAALQARGGQATTHLFDALADGGRIERQSDVDDPAAVDKIRRRLREIREAFASGDFSLQTFVHMRELPGMAVMAVKKDRIGYVYRDLPRGGELRLVTNDPDAIRAIHEFVAFLRERHRGGGRHHGARDHGARDHGARDHGAMHHGSGHTVGGTTP
jgi:hypothetical protein